MIGVSMVHRFSKKKDFRYFLSLKLHSPFRLPQPKVNYIRNGIFTYQFIFY